MQSWGTLRYTFFAKICNKGKTMSCEQLFLAGLRQRGFRLTTQRETVLVSLHDLARPATVEEILQHTRQKHSDVELTTVYRTLDLLHSMSLVTVIDTGDQPRQYELAFGEPPHVHLMCRVCGKITALPVEHWHPMVEKVKQLAGFCIDLDSITVHGACIDCTRGARHEHSSET